jgi:alanyl-tRNA synthetase
VLRRVMRRAIRHGHRLGIARPFLHEVALRVVDAMGDQYPELREKRDHIASVAEGEEIRFRQTIERGLSLLEERFEIMASEQKTTLAGADAFKLYDTYGFPLDLTNVICSERGFAVDEAGYKVALEEARERSEFVSKDHAIESVYREALATVPGGSVRFTGYEKDRDTGKLLSIIKDGALVQEASEGDSVELIADQTPFYGESGGQVGDHGVISTGSAKVVIEDSHKPIAGLVAHRGKVTSGTLRVGDKLDLAVDSERRDRTRRNHSATHLLHWALRQVLGSFAQQKGSLVGPERLRFDFTSPRALTPDEIQKVEDLVNQRTLANHTVRTEVLNMDEARSRGAMMIFEEKYGDIVRMLSMAESTELCGGTHARATGDIGLFKIVSEQGVSAGVRRIIAVTGDNSLAYLRDVENNFAKVVGLAKATPANVAEKIEKLLLHERALEKQIDELQRKLATGGGGGGLDALLAKARDIAGVKVLGVRTEVTDRAALRELAEQLRDKLGQSVVLVGSVADGKAQLVLTVAKDLTSRLKAGDLIKNSAQIVGGSGGGRPDMAQAGGTELARLDEAIDAIYASVG